MWQKVQFRAVPHDAPDADKMIGLQCYVVAGPPTTTAWGEDVYRTNLFNPEVPHAGIAVPATWCEVQGDERERVYIIDHDNWLAQIESPVAYSAPLRSEDLKFFYMPVASTEVQ